MPATCTIRPSVRSTSPASLPPVLPQVTPATLQGALQAKEQRAREQRVKVTDAEEGEEATWAAPKEITPIETLLLLPESAARDDTHELVVNRHVLAGWVEQESPCCAAASLACMFNALRRLDAKDGSAMKPAPVLAAFRDLFLGELADKRVTTARALSLPEASGAATLGVLLRCVEHRQAQKGKPITGRKERTVSTAELRTTLREVVLEGPDPAARELLLPAEQRPSESHEAILWQRLRFCYNVNAPAKLTAVDAPSAAPATDAPATTDAAAALPAAAASAAAPTRGAIDMPSGGGVGCCFSCFSCSGSGSGAGGGPTDGVRMYLLKRAPFEKFGVRVGCEHPNGLPLVTGLSGVGARSQLKVGDVILRVDGKEVASAEAATVAFARAGTSLSLHAQRPEGGADAPLEGRAAEADAALIKLLHSHVGFCKLTCDAPSTAAIGNAHLLRASTVLNGETEKCMRVYGSRFCGINRDDDAVLLSETDSAEAQEAQFQRLWTAFINEDTALIAHFWNHYAPIYALRKYHDRVSGEKQLELLTAKPAQRPSRWIAWGAMRGWLLQWNGYGILRFDRIEGSRRGESPWRQGMKAAPGVRTLWGPSSVRIPGSDSDRLGGPSAIDDESRSRSSI